MFISLTLLYSIPLRLLVLLVVISYNVTGYLKMMKVAIFALGDLKVALVNYLKFGTLSMNVDHYFWRSLSCRFDTLNWLQLRSNKSTSKQSENSWLQTPIRCQLQMYMKLKIQQKQESFKFIKAFNCEQFLFNTK